MDLIGVSDIHLIEEVGGVIVLQIADASPSDMGDGFRTTWYAYTEWGEGLCILPSEFLGLQIVRQLLTIQNLYHYQASKKWTDCDAKGDREEGVTGCVFRQAQEG